MNVLVSPAEMRAREERAIASGSTSAEALMEDAGRQIADAVAQFFPAPGRCVAFFGKGHNGGDALVAARHLARRGWRVESRSCFPRAELSELAAQQCARLEEMRSAEDLPGGNAPFVILDGLLGTGAGGPLREPVLRACREINDLRRNAHAHVFALDLPTGLDGDTGTAAADAVIADVTLTIGYPKRGLLADAALRHVGRLAVLTLRDLAKEEIGDPPSEDAAARAIRGSEEVATRATLARLLPRIAFDVHKGECGRIGIFAGSPGLTGAAVMCAEAAVRGGAGLVSLYVPEKVHAIIAAQTSPEVMVRPLEHPLELLETPRDVLAIGPGLGQEFACGVLELIARAPEPMILDADALNIVAGNLPVLERCAGARLLTPHPGEMARLDPGSKDRTRRETAEMFTDRFPHTLLFKGARSLIAQRGAPFSYNSTGHPGLATGGIGDLLTGLLAALIGQKLALYDAARLGTWLIGRAAELAVFEGHDSAESLRATAVLEHLGRAFRELRAGGY